ncbi:MAG: hypothetical protein AB8G22_15450 [Saprospiraceae bacterium]
MYYLPFIYCLLLSFSLWGQGTNVPLNNRAYHVLDRLDIKTDIQSPIFSSLRPFTRGDIVKYALVVDTAYNQVSLTSLDRNDLYYLFKDSNEWLISSTYPTTIGGKNELSTAQVISSRKDSRYTERKPLLKYFYKTPANLLEINQPFLHLRVNPILNLSIAQPNGDGGALFANQRGLIIRGGIDDRIYFYTSIIESQQGFANYINQRVDETKSLPGQGFYKNFQSSAFENTRSFDYLNSQGYIGFNVTKHVGIQFGYGRHFIGNGYRSLLLSDFSNNHLYLKLNWRIGRFHYQNLYTELTANSARTESGNGLLIKRFMTAHYFGYRLTKNITVGFYEAVVFSRNSFDFNYLNPVILYRTVEQAVGSPDNALLGFDAKWNLFNRFQIYGQLMLDEFKFDELFVEQRGWWGNKYAIQAGAKYIDAFGIDHFDVQYERNAARPYTYTHRDSSSAYAHLQQPLAHPVGANFKENLLILRYQPTKNLFFNTRWINIDYGQDPAGKNFGSNILIPHTTREMDFGNETGQGIATEVNIIGLELSYQFFHNMFIDLHYFYRNEDTPLDAMDLRTNYFGGGLRVNFDRPRLDF